MKKFLPVLLVLLGIIQGIAEEVTVHVDGQSLESLLTKEQIQSITTLNVTGKLANEDYVFLRDNSLPQLKTLNLKEADIDTIPSKAFENWNKGEEKKNFYNAKYIQFKFILPKNLEYIGDSAFYQHSSFLELEITGSFPECGKHIVLTNDGEYLRRGPSNFIQWNIAEGNNECIMNEGLVYSFNKEIVYQTNSETRGIDIAEGTKTIAAHAFEDCESDQIFLPETLDSIGDYAFHKLSLMPVIVNESGLYESYIVVCKASIPPLLGEKSLDFKNAPFALYVPDKSLELYKSANKWKDSFYIIEPISELRTSNPSVRNESFLSVRTLKQAFICISPTATKLEIYTMDATKVGEAAFANGEAVVKVGKAPATYLYIVTYPDGRRESGKVAVGEK